MFFGVDGAQTPAMVITVAVLETIMPVDCAAVATVYVAPAAGVPFPTQTLASVIVVAVFDATVQIVSIAPSSGVERNP